MLNMESSIRDKMVAVQLFIWGEMPSRRGLYLTVLCVRSGHIALNMESAGRYKMSVMQLVM